MSNISLLDLKKIVNSKTKKLPDVELQMLDNTIVPFDAISSGCASLDLGLGGGWARGRIVELFGDPSTGKSTVSYTTMVEAQKRGIPCILIDAEQAFNKSRALQLGLDVEEMLFVQPMIAEQIFTLISNILDTYKDWINKGVTTKEDSPLIIVDSVEAMVANSEDENDFGAHNVGTKARVMSQGLRKIVYDTRSTNSTIMFTNQLRTNIAQMYGDPSITTGGKALPFHASQRVRLSRVKKPTPTYQIMKWNVKKNKMAPPYAIGETKLFFHEDIPYAFDSNGELFMVAVAAGIINKKGGWYDYTFKDELIKAQGGDSFVNLFSENPEMVEEIRRKTFPSQYV